MRVAALEDNVAFLEEWCEEQQDVLDRTVAPVSSYSYEIESDPEPATARAVLRVVDLRDEVFAEVTEVIAEPPAQADATILAVVETEHDRKVRQIRARLDRLKGRLEAQV